MFITESCENIFHIVARRVATDQTEKNFLTFLNQTLNLILLLNTKTNT